MDERVNEIWAELLGMRDAMLQIAKVDADRLSYSALKRLWLAIGAVALVAEQVKPPSPPTSDQGEGCA